MVKKRKTSKNKNSKRRSILRIILSAIGRFIGWLLRLVFRNALKNPLLAIGYFIFIVSFGFVGYNAIFAQTSSHKSVFIQTRPSLLNDAQRKSDNSLPNSTSGQLAGNQLPPIRQTAVVSQQMQATSLPETLADTQKELTRLGLYDGAIDGLDGPKTQNAIATWKNKYGVKQQNQQTTEISDDIATVILRNKPNAVDTITTRAVNLNVPSANSVNAVNEVTASASKVTFDAADIMRVQAALRSFGNVDVVVTGVEDDKTSYALSQFQKMFSLPVTGKIDQDVLVKMREIGLIG